MAKLEFYRQQVVPRIATPSTRGLAAVGTQAADTAEAIARGAVAVGQLVEKRNVEIEKAREDEAAIDASSRAIRIKSRWLDKERELEQDALENNRIDDYATRAQAAYQEIANEEVQGAMSDRARSWLQGQADSFGLNVQDGSLRWQSNARVERNVNKVEKSIEASRLIVSAKPQEYDSVINNLSLEFTALPANKRDRAWMKAKSDLALDAALSSMKSNPFAIQKALEGDPDKSPFSFIKDLDQDDRNALARDTEAEINRLESKAKARQAERRELLRERVADQSALLASGYTIDKPISRAEFVAAGMGESYGKYQESLRTGAIASSFIGMTGEQIRLTLNSQKPTPDEEGYASRLANYNALQNSAAKVLSERQEDPIQFAESRNLMTVGVLDPSNPTQFAAELRNRATVGKTMRSEFGTPTALLKKNEVDAFSGMLGNMTSVQKTDFLRQISTSVDKQSYLAMMRQLSPGTPVTAMAGAMMAVDGSIVLREGTWGREDQIISVKAVAAKILQGEDLLNPTDEIKKSRGKADYPMPPDSQLRPIWNSIVGDAYRGDTQSELAAYQAFRAFYAAEKASIGENDGLLDDTTARKAARAVTGGITEWNASKIVLPWGMAADTALTILREQFKTIRGPAGLPQNAELDDYELMTVGDGKYVVLQGTTPLFDKNGNYIYVQVRK